MGLKIHDVAYSFGNRLASDGVSFDVAPGVITGLLGPNGAGKTTLLRILLGVLTPDRGEVRFDGQPVGEDDRRHLGLHAAGARALTWRGFGRHRGRGS